MQYHTYGNAAKIVDQLVWNQPAITMVYFQLGPYTTLWLDEAVFSPEYLQWFDQMLLEPTESLFQTAPSYGGTSWVNGQWCLYHTQGGADNDDSYYGRIVTICAPIKGELADRLRATIVEHMPEKLCSYYNYTNLSQITSRTAVVHANELTVDRTLDVLHLLETRVVHNVKDIPLAEIVLCDINNTQNTSELDLRASRLLIVDVTTQSLHAPFIWHSLFTANPSRYHCQHLVLDSRERIVYDRIDASLVTVYLEGVYRHYLPDGNGGGEPLGTETRHFPAMVILPGLEHCTADLYMKIDDQPTPGLMQVGVETTHPLTDEDEINHITFWVPHRSKSAQVNC